MARIVTIESLGVDACISIRDAEVALQLVGYLQPGWYHADEVAESDLRGRMSRSLRTEGIQETDIRIGWRTELPHRRTSSSSQQRCVIPRSRDSVAAFLKEFVRFVPFARGLEGAQDHPIYLRSNVGLGARNLQHDSRCAAASEYPVMTQYCDSIRVQNTCVGLPSIRSSFEARGIGFDRQQLAESVRDHVSNLSRYRKRVGSRPIWLVIHSDSWPTSPHLRELDRDAAFELVRHQCGNSTERFDAVWWLDGAAFTSRTLHRLC